MKKLDNVFKILIIRWRISTESILKVDILEIKICINLLKSMFLIHENMTYWNLWNAAKHAHQVKFMDLTANTIKEEKLKFDDLICSRI